MTKHTDPLEPIISEMPWTCLLGPRLALQTCMHAYMGHNLACRAIGYEAICSVPRSAAVQQLASVVEYLHSRHIVHRQVAPMGVEYCTLA